MTSATIERTKGIRRTHDSREQARDDRNRGHGSHQARVPRTAIKGNMLTAGAALQPIVPVRVRGCLADSFRLAEAQPGTSLTVSVRLISRASLLDRVAGEITRLLISTKARLAATMPVAAGDIERDHSQSIQPMISQLRTAIASRLAQRATIDTDASG